MTSAFVGCLGSSWLPPTRSQQQLAPPAPTPIKLWKPKISPGILQVSSGRQKSLVIETTGLESGFLKCGPRPTASAAPGNFLGTQSSRLHPDPLTQKLRRWGWAACVLTVFPGASDECWNVLQQWFSSLGAQKFWKPCNIWAPLQTNYLRSLRVSDPDGSDA